MIWWMREWQETLFLGFQKAFDKVPQRRISAKVRAYEVAGKVDNWIGN